MKKLLNLLILLMVISCTKKSLDLSKIAIGDDAENINLNIFRPTKTMQQFGHFELVQNGNELTLGLVDSGEKVTTYYFVNENVGDLNYLGYPVDSVLGAKIIVYNGKVEYIGSEFVQSSNDNLLGAIIENLGTPTEVIKNNILKETIDLDAYQILKSELSSYIIEKMEIEGSPSEIIYPQWMVWDKDNILYVLDIDPLNNYVNIGLHIMSKKALKDKVIFGFHNPAKDPLLSKYIY